MKHYNPTLSEDAARIFNSKQGDYIGDEVTGIVAVVPITRKANIVRRGTGTIYNVPSDKDFYLVAAELSIVKDAANTGTLSSLRINVDGATQPILEVTAINATPQATTIAQNYPVPIKCDRGSSIAITNTGTFSSQIACIVGYTVETTKGV